MTKPMFFAGMCPFLTCQRTRPHTHPVCEECGAARYGNMFCAWCQLRRAERPFVEVDG